jgi:predicted HicB family RNase H-like nuclease
MGDSQNAAAMTLRPLAWDVVADRHSDTEPEVRVFEGETGRSRQQLLSYLLCNARYAFHAAAKTHIYYCRLNDLETVNAAHSFRDKAFDQYVATCARVSLEMPTPRVVDVLEAMEANALTPLAAPGQGGKKACSGVVNVRLSADLAIALRQCAESSATSINRLCRDLLEQEARDLAEHRRAVDPREFGLLVNSQTRDIDRGVSEQFTCRVGTSVHMDLLALARMYDVSIVGLATFLMIRRLSVRK